jgi:hypothetical protein
MSQQMVMRREILALFAYPRQLAMANIDLSSCPHGEFFKAMDASCRQCAKNYECVWLNSTDEFNGLAGKSMEFLYRALTFGIDYVDARNAPAKHDRESCECESCEWVKDAHHVAHEYIKSAT